MSIIHIFFKIIFLSPFSIISHRPPPNPSFFLIHNTLLSLWLYQFSASPSFFFCFVLFLRIFFFPLLLLQFEYYAFIINDDIGLGLIKGSDFGHRKQKFWVEKMVILASPSFFLLLLLLLFSISDWLFIWICIWVWWIFIWVWWIFIWVCWIWVCCWFFGFDMGVLLMNL